ncbi:uncharacterized protein stbd1 [Parambassis ranga]|uniref:Starch-binding domain-containing protein 1 n=1 Tax=Parambassis ranga TaxID=210632 RepID=A0A6P7JDD6_9TELE|nr:starch-binding domain-containing protein 1 [Parambassis ranga]
MQLKNDNTVALERRMDLASLFCMIGRHGPAVALAVIAMVSVVVGFIIYRTVKGKWRKATAGSDSKSPGAERDASLIQTEEEPKESRSPVDSTDVRDGELSDADLIQSDVRHRRCAAAEKTPPPPPSPPPYYPPESDSVPGSRHHAPAVQDCSKVTESYSEDQTNHSPQCDTEAEVEADDDPHQNLTEEHDEDRCVTPELIHNGSYGEEEQVLCEEKCPHSENISTEKDVSEEKTSEEENFPDSPVCFEQYETHETLHQDEVAPDTYSTVTNTEDPVTHNEESCVCDLKDDDYSYSNDHIISEVEAKNQCEEAAEECVDLQLSAKQVDNVHSSFEEEIIPPSQQEEPCDDVIDERVDAMVENICVDHESSLVDCNAISLQQDLQTEEENGFEDDDDLKEEILTSCEHDRSNVVVTPPLSAVEPEEVDNVDDALCSITSDVKGVDVLEMSKDYQQPQESVKADELGDLTILCPDLTSLEEEIQSEKNETSTVGVLSEEGVPFCFKDEPREVEIEEIFQNIGVTSATEFTLCDEENLTAPTEVSHPDALSPLKGGQMQNNEDFTEVAPGASPESIKTSMRLIHLPSFEQSELMSFGEESGISSMAVSPDLQDAGDEFVTTPENVQIPLVDCPPQSENQTGAQISLFADDVALSVGKACTELANDESFAANEDMFGHEVEDSYHREMEHFMAQIVASIPSLTSETTKKTDIKEGAEKEEEEECEKTEISIMEATMDNNEWITDGNYQVLPWMNLPIPPLVQNHTKFNPGPNEEHQHCPSPVDITFIDTDIPNSVEARPADTLPLAEEITENNKKVVAVQPMPQNVNVTFRIHYLPHSPFQTVAITGDHKELGNWKGFVPLERAKDGHWATVVSLPTDSHVEWKFVVLDKGEVCRWEECGNRLLDTGYGDDLLVHKWWGLM